VTNTAVSSLPTSRSGVAGATTSTARQVGISIGIALAGSFAAGAADFTSASLPVWIIVAGCGLALFGIAAGLPELHPAATPQRIRHKRSRQ
ncbi:MAG: MFS transporter, partial [Gordonia amarae]